MIIPEDLPLYLGERVPAIIVPREPGCMELPLKACLFKLVLGNRSEKKVLNDINHSKETQQMRFHVMTTAGGHNSHNKIKERISTGSGKAVSYWYVSLFACC